jgi:transglutaminase/protease-like cytokinesis protein 3
MRSLVSYLIDDTQSELERVRALWIWEATHVVYDGRRFSVRDVPSLDAELVFIRRAGVCIDYSVLFERLAMLAGIRAPVVVGVASGYPKAILLGDASHAWNAARIDGAWYLLDVTWSSGYLDESFTFHHADPPDESYFLAEPARFVRSHLPEDPFWQLLPRPISMSTFLEIAAGK